MANFTDISFGSHTTKSRCFALMRLNADERLGEDGKYLLAVGRQYALLCEIEEAKEYVKLAIKADSSLKAEFLDDPAFDPVWESF